jgi:hypothetical protein
VHGGHSLVVWRKVFMPKELGGLGIPSPRLMNMALHAGRWLWLSRVGDSKPRKELDIQVPLMARHLFGATTLSTLVDGATTLF